MATFILRKGKWQCQIRRNGHRSISKTFSQKRDAQRIIPLMSRSEAILEGISSPSESVFNISTNAIRLAWQRVKKNANLGSVRFHNLRHEAISRFFEMGLTVPEVAAISGHKTTSMLSRYAHADTQRLREKILNVRV